MSDERELRRARERLRINSYPDSRDTPDGYISEERNADLWTIVDAYLAEHPADGDELIDGNWLDIELDPVLGGKGVCHTGGGRASPEEAEANARLIAQAPDMLAELVKLELVLTNMGWTDSPVLHRVRDVIQRATEPT